MTSGTTIADVRVDESPARRRAELASTWPTAAEVSIRLGSTTENASHLATRLRRDGKLLGVYLPLPSPSYRYPTWQFDEGGLPVRLIPEILAVLREKGPFKIASQCRSSGWAEVEWFRSRHALLNGERPADVLATDPGAVLRAAQIEFGEDGDGIPCLRTQHRRSMAPPIASPSTRKRTRGKELQEAVIEELYYQTPIRTKDDCNARIKNTD
ncbi:antitoxin Xre/MbcA/ParS toxin-binding domain-containing protein [Stenotrophomonas oahuensis]|uniref:DUF2384 domain-containing protein n=1 Tax=Stenotrophomonas oahuensis TaxID=3003271 RepID=A0ABY9YK20_9GAMM|nr:antitoxin Xre/MbcA/ParS toxin-binding domain-containing protein [Stenotrophomonas sp. A5586]WNH51237.1 DUF2384 domain-containing protein [Stenotrophomonas sp. A5586]